MKSQKSLRRINKKFNFLNFFQFTRLESIFIPRKFQGFVHSTKKKLFLKSQGPNRILKFRAYLTDSDFGLKLSVFPLKITPFCDFCHQIKPWFGLALAEYSTKNSFNHKYLKS